MNQMAYHLDSSKPHLCDRVVGEMQSDWKDMLLNINHTEEVQQQDKLPITRKQTEIRILIVEAF